MQNLGDFLEKNDKLIRRSALIMVVVVIGLTIGLRVMPALTSHFNKKTYLSLNFAPASATIAINGETYRNGVYEFEPGTYEISVTADNFISKTYTATVSENSETDVVGYLRCKDKTLECYKENEDDFEVLIQVADDNARDFVETWRKISSIKYILPIKKEFFDDDGVNIWIEDEGRVSAAYIEIDESDSKSCKPGNFCLEVSGNATSDDYIRSALEEKGFDINDYQIIKSGE